ncbi:PH domain-containing protein [Sphingomonas sp. AOB5]|uniref:PH domain-containing protein n=1 Tax=Sphingomonas sp. AOB5 TaxID=3034017 RepID=UPI0023F76F2E|nr:PH domain-containing protein [Sphingomonas sp. AOB5]MDF7773978.1 PH domain-containing protein [Sphingomonas sp. AOB5]
MSDGLDYLDEPRRLHPASLFIGWIKGLPQFAGGIVAIGVALRESPWLVVAAGGILAISGLIALLKWRNFTYRIDGDALVIEQGLLSRSRRAIPLERIQDVSIEQGLLARLLGLVIVKIETGGGVADEGSLNGVGLAEAKRLRETLRSGTRIATGSVAEVAEATPETALFAMSFGRILLFGAFNFSLLWMAALFGAFQFFDDFLPFDRDQLFEWLDVAGHEASARFGIALVLGIIGLLLVLGFVSGLLGTVLREFGFRLTQGEGRFRRVRGLLTRSEVAIAIRRIQLALIERRPITNALGYASLQFQSLGGSNDAGGRQEMAPFARAEEIEAIVAAAGMPRFERPGMKPVAAGHVARSFVEKALPFIVAVIVAGAFFTRWAWLGMILVPFIIGVSLLLRRFHRYALRGTSLQVMRGVLRRREWVVPYDSVQVVTIRQGIVQRMLGIASVEVDTAGAKGRARPDVEDVLAADAIELARDLGTRAAG